MKKTFGFFLGLGLLTSLSAQAAGTINLDSKTVKLGNLGAVTNPQEVETNGKFTLVRTKATPKRLDVEFVYKAPEAVCSRYERYAYPCGGYNYPYPRPGYPYPYPGYPYPGYPYPGYGMCYSSRCVEWTNVMMDQSDSIRLNFVEATELRGNEKEEFELDLKSDGKDVYYEVIAPGQYEVKKFERRIKFIAH